MANNECESRFVGKRSTSNRIATWSVPPTLKKIRHRLSEDRRCHPSLIEPLSLNANPLLLSTEELEKSIGYSLVSIEPLLLLGKGKLLSNKTMSVSAKH